MFVEPVYLFQIGELDRFQAPPGTSATDCFGLEEADHSFYERIIVAVADAADRRFNPCLGEMFCTCDRHLLRGSPVAVVYQPIVLDRASVLGCPGKLVFCVYLVLCPILIAS